MPPRPTPKKDAVLAIGLDRSTAEIIAGAKENGVEVSATYVELLRKGPTASAPTTKAKGKSRSTRSKTPSAKTSRAVKAPSAAKTSASASTTKAAYVRSLGPGLKPGEVMERAKADGVKLTIGYVYNMRKAAKKAGGRGANGAGAANRGPGRPRKDDAPASATVAKRGPGRPRKAAAAESSTRATSLSGSGDRAFRTAVAGHLIDHGIAHVRALVEEMGAKLLAAAGA